MQTERRENRRQELVAIRLAAPGQLIAIYRTANKLDELAPLPSAITMNAIIESILDSEESGPDLGCGD